MSSNDEWRVYKRGSMSEAVDDGSSVLRFWWWLAFFKARETRADQDDAKKPQRKRKE